MRQSQRRLVCSRSVKNVNGRKNWKIKQILMKFMINGFRISWSGLFSRLTSMNGRGIKNQKVLGIFQSPPRYPLEPTSTMIFFIQLVCILSFLLKIFFVETCVISKEIQIKIKIIWKWSFRYFSFLSSFSVRCVLRFFFPSIWKSLKFLFLIIVAAVSCVISSFLPYKATKTWKWSSSDSDLMPMQRV